MTAVPIGIHLGWIGLGIGAAALLVLGLRTTRHPWHHLLAFLVPAFTTLSYVAMAFGQGTTTLSTGRVFYWARWADAVVGATLLLLNTALIALPRSTSRRNALFTGIAAANGITMLCGLFAGGSTDPAARWTWYLIGVGAYAAVLWMLFVRVPAQARQQGTPARRRRMYRRLIAVLIGVAVLYPIWWLFTPVGIGWVGAPTALLVFAFLDLLSKAGYGLLLVTQVRKLPESTRGW